MKLLHQLQAAAVLTGRSFEELFEAWSLTSTVVEPTPGVDGTAIRAAYAAAARSRDDHPG